MCKYNLAWVGKCGKEANESGFCDEHEGEKCVSCGGQATKQCYETMGPFVCGAPLCDGCEHTICENGCNSGAPLPEGLGAHCRKEEQVYKPWFMNETEENK